MRKNNKSFAPYIFLLGFFYYILCFSVSINAQEIVINEIMGSNATTIADEDGDHEDWIELYNYGEVPVDLKGYGLSDDYDNPFRWVLPEVVIQPGEFMLIWASGKGRNEPSQPLHTNFRISYTGEEVIITCPDGTRIDELEPTTIPTDISYGRKPDGSGQWKFFDKPTPGEPNLSEAYPGILSPPIFSHSGGFYKDSFILNIFHHNPNVEIFYTLDGSEPDPGNLDGTTYHYKNRYPETPDDPFGKLISGSYRSLKYSEPIGIIDRSQKSDKITGISSTWDARPDYFPALPVSKGSVVRAVAVKDSYLPSPVITNTYFIYEEGRERYNLPVISINAPENLFFDYEEGIYVAGIDFDKWREENPNAKADGDTPSNYRRRGAEYEMGSNFEFFEKGSNEAAINQNIGVRIHGGWSRSYPLKSLRLYARNKYSTSEFNYRFFDDLEDDSFKRLLLRTSGNDFYSTMFRDALIQKTVGNLNFDTQAFQPSIVFINGEFWGIHNIRERYDKHYLKRVYAVDPENIDLLTWMNVVKEGNNHHYNQTRSYIREHGLKEDEHYQYILTRIDEENFMDYNIAEIYARNTDWPGSNIDYWRLRTNEFEEDSEYGHDGRWRWLLFDTDFGFGLMGDSEAYKHNTLDFATETDGPSWPNPDWSTFLLRSFLENDTFKKQFINRFADLLNTHFLPERVLNIIDEYQKLIEDDISEHISRWENPGSVGLWRNNVEVMTEFAEKRPFYQRKHLKDFFGLEGLNVKLDVSNQYEGHIKINTIEINCSTPGISEYPYPWQGKYFKEIPVETEAIPAPGYRFSHWEGSSKSTSNKITLNEDDDVYLKANFERTGKPVLIHYWLFDTSLPNDTPFEKLEPYYSTIKGAEIEYRSCLEGYPYNENHPNWRKASMERRNNPTPINYRPEGNQNTGYSEVDMRALQVRQPFVSDERQNEIIFHLPTYGFSGVVFRFAAMDEGAAGELIVDYKIDSESGNWTTSGLQENVFELDNEYRFYEIDFSDIPGADNNTGFKIRTRFDGENMSEDEGNRVTFNNISLDGVALPTHSIRASSGNNGNINPLGNIPVYHGSSRSFTIVPYDNHEISEVFIDGVDVAGDLKRIGGDTAIYTFSNIEENHTIHTKFSIHSELIEEHDGNVIIYPNPVNEKVTISALETITRIDIANVAGQVLNTYNHLSSNSHTINIGHLNSGFYIVIVYTKDGVVSKKMQVIK